MGEWGVRGRIGRRAWVAVVAGLVAAGCGSSSGTTEAGPADPSTTASAAGASTTAGEGTTTIRPDLVPNADGVLLRVSMAGDGDVEVVLLGDGTVVHVAQTDVYRTVDDFTTWQATDEVVAEVQAAVRDAGAWFEGEDRTSTDQASYELNHQLRELLLDPANRQGEATAWVPDTLTVSVKPAVPGEHVVGWPETWPLAVGPGDLALQPSEQQGDVACLEGEDAAAVFGLLTQEAGFNTSRVPVVAGDDEWTLGIGLAFPGYRLDGDPC